MRTEQRWPDYAQRVAAHGVLSSLSVPLPFQGATIGAIPAGGCGNRLSRAPKGVRATGAYCGWMRQSVFARACA
jgi:hypothetical protein